jgi:hypothetical protein
MKTLGCLFELAALLALLIGWAYFSGGGWL